MREYCARYIFEIERIKTSPKLLEFYKLHEETIEYMKKESGFPIPDDADPVIRGIQRTSVLFDILYSQVSSLVIVRPTIFRACIPV